MTRIPKGSLGVSMSYGGGGIPDHVYGPGTHILLREVDTVSLANQRATGSFEVNTQEGLPVTVDFDVRYNADWNSAEDVALDGGLGKVKSGLINMFGDKATEVAQKYSITDLAQIGGDNGVGSWGFPQEVWTKMIDDSFTLADLNVQGMTVTVRLTPAQRAQIAAYDRENGGVSTRVLSQPAVAKLGPYLLAQLTNQEMQSGYGGGQALGGY